MLLPALLMLAANTIALAADEAELIQPDAEGIKAWQSKRFAGETHYRPDHVLHRDCIRAESKASASGLFRKVDIDLNQTPFLEWSWWVPKALQNSNERAKSGDDFAARIYLVISGGLLFWNTRAINYVWANAEPVGAMWPNPFTANSAMLAVESGNRHAGQWRHYRRDIRADLQRYFGKTFDHIDAVAIMTDSDNSKQKASACYASIRFSGKAEPLSSH